MSIEITILVKDADKTNRQKFLCYDNSDGIISLSHDCEKMKSIVAEAVANFKGVPDEIIVRASFVW